MYLCRLISNDSGKYGKTEENITRHPQGNSLFRIRDSIYLVINQRFKQGRCPDDLLLDVTGQQPARMVFHHAFGRGNCSGGPCLPRLGEVLRCTFLQRYENVPFQKSLGTVILERAVDLVCWLFLLIIAMLLNNGLLSQLVVDQETGTTLQEWFAQKGLSYIGNYLIYIVIAVIALIVIIIRATRNWWQKKPALVKVADFFKGIWHGFVSIKDIPKPWHFVFWTIAMWVFYFFGVYLFFHALPYLQHVGPGAAFTVLVFGTIAFIISQGGLGAYPLITAGIVMLYGISYTQGLAAGWIGWILQTAVSLVLGFFSLAVTSFYKKHDAAQIPEENE